MANNDMNFDEIILKDTEDLKVFEGLKFEAIKDNQELFKLLELNAEQLTYYLEEVILDNPFINIDYSIEQTIPAFEKFEKSRKLQENNNQSLDTYLFEQILLYRQTEIRDTMVQLISLIDERGYLPYGVEELADKIQRDPIVTLDALTLVKQLEPRGIGAFDLRECLMIQTEQDEFAPKDAYSLLEDYFEDLTQQDYQHIHERTDISLEKIQECVNYYYMLRRTPASLFDRVAKINLIPDMSVQGEGNVLSIRYNRQYYPKISFDYKYFEEMQQREDPELISYIEPHATFYHQLANDLRLREQILIETMVDITKSHQEFFQGQSKELSPLSIRNMANRLRLPETLIYRIISNKNVEFNTQVYPLSDFINVSQQRTREGFTANYIKNYIRDIITDSKESLSDQEIVDILASEQIVVGRQIVANYRKNLGL